jgi:photosystem II stability/assembly factor-like uncharacterized protein
MARIRVAFVVLTLIAVAHAPHTGATLAAQSAPGPAVDAAHLNLLRWRSIGPSRGGRVLAVTGDPVNKFTFYQGTTGGGVWKTDDGGINWANVSDGYFATGSVGAIEVAPSNPNVIYVGMGEACFRGNASYGDGVYKSADAGKTWTKIGLEATRQIGRLQVHPTNPDIAYVAALGDAWGPSPDRGVYRTRDGGRTWQKVLYRNENAGAIDIVLDPSNPNVLYASTLELRRYPWGFRSAGPGTALYKSTDGGDTWTDLSGKAGLPKGDKGRIGIALAPSRPNRVWAIIDAAGAAQGIYRTDDGGETWTQLTDNADLTQRPWYYHHIFADPKNAEVLWALNVDLWKSTDGGTTFTEVTAPHGDFHGLWIDPQDPMRMVNGNDGGATVTFNGGRSWSTILNQPTAQLYHVAVDNAVPYRVYAAQQDNTTISVPSRSDHGRITIEEWETVGGGEDGYVAPHPTDPNIVYAADHHWLHRYDRRTKQVRDISPNPETHYGWGAADINFRFWWTFPVMVSPHDPKTLYVTSQKVHRTRNEGQSWEVISPDLSRADPKTLEKTPSYLSPSPGEFWGPITREAYGPEWYATIFAFAESPKQAGVLWAGSDDGYVHVSRDNGESWTKVTPPDLPEFALISIIDPSPHDAATAYVAATRFKLQDNAPYLYKTTNYGQTWTKIVDGIPRDDFTRVVREDPGRKGLLVAGTETGVYVSVDDGSHWQSLRRNLPVVPVHDLVFKNGDVVAATHGRSFWVLDNVALLHQMTPAALADAVRLFEPRPTVRYGRGASLAGNFATSSGVDGVNPPAGVVVPFFLKERPTSPVTLAISKEGTGPGAGPVTTITFDPEGAVLAGSRRPVARAGANTYVWDMRYPPPTVLPGAVFQGRAAGPLAPPGTYTLTLTANGATTTTTASVIKDPRLTYTDAELEEQFAFLMTVRDRLSETMSTVGQIRDTRAKAEELVKKAKQTRRGQRPEAAALLDRAMQDLNNRLYTIEERLVQYRAKAGQDLIANPTGIDSKLAQLLGFASMGDGPPTEGAKDLLRRLNDGIQERKTALGDVEKKELAILTKLANTMLR